MKDLPRTVLIGLIALTVLRLVLAAVNEISPDEAYYTMWSERMAPSYYSKGPGIATTLKISTSIFGKTPLGVRFFSPVLALCTSLLIFRLARSLFDERVGAWAVLLLNITPLFNAGSLIMNIDPLSVFFWVAAMLTFWLALRRAAPFSLYWPATGLLIGLGFLCKYTNAFELLSIVLLLTLRRRWRRQFRSPGIYLLFATFAVCTIPVLIWNSQNGWITFTHLHERGRLDESTGIHVTEFLEYIAMHLGVYSPLIFAGLVWALTLSVRQFFRHDSQAFVIAFSLPVIVTYFLLSWRDAGEVNWTAPGFIGVGVLLAYHWQHVRLPKNTKTALRNTAIWVSALICATMMNTDILRRSGIPWPYPKDPSKRILGWKETSTAVEGIIRKAAEDLGEPVFLIGNKYQTAAVLNFYLPGDIPIIRPDKKYPPVFCLEHPLPQNQFSFWPRYEAEDPQKNPTSPYLGKTALYITDDASREGAPSKIRETFPQYEVTSVIDITRRGQILRTIKVFACFDYRGQDL